jgi:hypothetical protein
MGMTEEEMKLWKKENAYSAKQEQAPIEWVNKKHLKTQDPLVSVNN